MAKTEKLGLKFTLKESVGGTPFLGMEFTSGPAGAFGGAEFYLNFRNRVDVHEAQRVACELNERFDDLSVLTF